jgi:hypothetical protein
MPRNDKVPTSPIRQSSMPRNDKVPTSPIRQSSLGRNDKAPLSPESKNSLREKNLNPIAESNSQEAPQIPEIMNELDPQAFGIAKNVDKIPTNDTHKGRVRAERVLAGNKKTTKSKKSLKGPG